MLWLRRNGLLQPINRFRNDDCLWSHCEVRRTEAIVRNDSLTENHCKQRSIDATADIW